MAERGICFSSAVIWRCSALTSLENELLIIGPALQLIFSFSLIFTNWSSGKRNHLFLSAEGIAYFLLSLLELLSHILAAAQQNVAVFNVLDIVLAATSFIPILFYTFFVFSLVRNLVTTLPKRFQKVVKVLFLVFIPAIIAQNEVASFVGIKRGTIPMGPSNTPTIVIGFDATTNGYLLWSFFTSFTLALLTAYQAMAFTLAFYRVITVALNQRRIEASASDEAHLFRGIGWIAAGLKFGAVESVVGFAGPSFGMAMTRRLFKAFGRALLCIGVAKGVDAAENFLQLQEEMGGPPTRKQFRRSKLMQAIGNPRHSTFQHMSPTATAFHSAPHAYAPNTAFRSNGGAPGMREFAQYRGSPLRRERVTVHYGGGAAPMLQMRFSDLDMPSPMGIVNSIKTLPQSEFSQEIAAVKRRTAAVSLETRSPSLSETEWLRSQGRPRSFDSSLLRPGSHVSAPESMNTLNVVQELAGQFPHLPAQNADSRPASVRDSGVSVMSSDSFVSSRPSYTSPRGRRSSQFMSVAAPIWHVVPSPVTEEGSVLDVPRDLDANYASNPTTPHRQPVVDNYDIGRPLHSATDTYTTTSTTNVSRFTHRTVDSTTTMEVEAEDPAMPYELPDGSAEYRDLRRSSGVVLPSQWAQDDKPMEALAAAVMQEKSRYPDSARRGHTSQHSSVSWVDPAIAVTQLSSGPRKLSVAPRRMPALSKTDRVRGSVHVDLHIVPPPPHSHGTEIVQSDSPSTYGSSLLRDVLRDDEVVELENGRF